MEDSPHGLLRINTLCDTAGCEQGWYPTTTMPPGPPMLLSPPVPLSHQLLPVHNFQLAFTTSSYIKHPRVKVYPLEDKPLGVHKVSSKFTHDVVTPPNSTVACDKPGPKKCDKHSQDPKEAWEAIYPEGSINPSATIPGGFSFYLAGPQEFKDRLVNATEAVFSYRMMLQEDWEWVKGGKLPGLCECCRAAATRRV